MLTFGAFAYLQASRVFADPDSFYHIKIAQLMAERGVVDDFPWLTFTGLTQYYTDQHFLYHVALIPFVSFMDPILGAKIATALINAILVVVFAAMLIRFRVRWWPLFLAVFLVTNPLLFRLNLVKAPGFSLIFLIVGLWLLFRKKHWWLALLSFAYVWAYGGFVLLGIATAVYAAIYAIHAAHAKSFVHSLFWRIIPRGWKWKVLRQSVPVKVVIWTAGGLLVGVLIHPYFPDNLFYYWQQLVQIGIINFQKVVNVGGEWHAYPFIELVANTVFVSISVLIATIFLAAYRSRQSAETWALWVLTVFFFVITLKSRRYVEIYVPIAILFAAFSFRDALPKTSVREVWGSFVGFFQRRTLLASTLTLYIVVATLTIVVRDLRQLNNDLKSGSPVGQFQEASAWLAANTPEQSIVVHSDWDDFPVLFYHNTHNRYIVGLDPTFMYQFDRVLYKRWADLTSGRRGDEATQIITQDLQSEYVLVAHDHQPFNAIMKRNADFTQVYTDAESTIYHYTGGGTLTELK